MKYICIKDHRFFNKGTSHSFVDEGIIYGHHYYSTRAENGVSKKFHFLIDEKPLREQDGYALLEYFKPKFSYGK
jgi:hypothetical protein